jgi:hypothetical protein
MRERVRHGRTLLAASALAALVLLAAAQPPLPPLTATENRVWAVLPGQPCVLALQPGAGACQLPRFSMC